jgi:hypothetical protein
MKTKGRPKLTETKDLSLVIRLNSSERQTFKNAADLAGISLSTWVRERLRWISIRELQEASLPIPFLKNKSLKN